MPQNMLGAYGAWAAGLLPAELPALSFRQERFKTLSAWRPKARSRVLELLAQPELGGAPKPRGGKKHLHEGLYIEELSWQLPAGPRTEAVFIKPAGAKGPLPAVLALHDHGGNKYFGWRKIARLPGRTHPLLGPYRQNYYGGVAWANELARRGYAVLVHDTFLFGSRRIRYPEVPEVLSRGRKERNPEAVSEIAAYNQWAADQETIVAKSLFCAGTTWPGVFLAEDQRALDYPCSRPDVDPERVGCGGLSGGGLRTVFLAGLDERIRAAVCAGFMSTWRDFLLHKSHTHTWMAYVPLLPKDLDFPEILGLRVPRPTLVLNTWQDTLYTPKEMKEAHRILGAVYAKAKAADRYTCSFHQGLHKFDLPMQAEAFAFWDRWLK
jgi:dienelactone hydrolase